MFVDICVHIKPPTNGVTVDKVKATDDFLLSLHTLQSTVENKKIVCLMQKNNSYCNNFNSVLLFTSKILSFFIELLLN